KDISTPTTKEPDMATKEHPSMPEALAHLEAELCARPLAQPQPQPRHARYTCRQGRAFPPPTRNTAAHGQTRPPRNKGTPNEQLPLANLAHIRLSCPHPLTHTDSHGYTKKGKNANLRTQAEVHRTILERHPQHRPRHTT